MAQLQVSVIRLLRCRFRLRSLVLSPLDQKICELANPELTVSEVAALAGCDRSHIYRCISRYGLILKQRQKPPPRESAKNKILALADGYRTSAEIAEKVGCTEKHVQNILRVHNAKRLPRGARNGELNSSFRGGRFVDLDGYAVVRAPTDHPHARRTGIIFEHRLIAEKKLGRYLQPTEVVDHIDGLHLHNDPDNLRVFDSNADHLRATISGQRPNWSIEGFAKMQIPSPIRPNYPQVDSYRQRRKCGDVRLLQILLAASRLGIDSPHLLGTHHHLVKAQIDYSQPTMIKHALAELFPEWA
ncbi:HNH endonuclease [Yersinia enterocolitica]|uniref:HNH endonuclease n=1 Tax=Yersinia enterocolitica TaxID=630 RepID=UPI003BFA74FC